MSYTLFPGANPVAVYSPTTSTNLSYPVYTCPLKTGLRRTRSLSSLTQPPLPQFTSNRTSNRYSTYSASPSFATSARTSTYMEPLVHGSRMHTHSASLSSTTPITPEASAAGMAEIKQLTQGLDRLENKHLAQQRFVPGPKKTDEMSKLALGAKLERALGRRMTDQDAVLRIKTKANGDLSEKVGIAK